MTGRQHQSTRGNIRGRGRARPLNENEIQKLLGSIKLCRVSPEDNTEEPSLDDVKVVVRESVLQGLSDSNKELEVTLRKCHKSKRYDLVPLTKLVNILQGTENEMPQLISKFQDEVVCTLSNGPQNFYLQWTLQAKRLYLFGKWMYDMCERNKLELIKNAVKTKRIGIQTLVGRYVSVPYKQSYEPIRARGLITEVVSELNAKVYLIDYGEEVEFVMTDIRVLPMELNQDDVKPCCFPARLINLQPFSNSSTSSSSRIQGEIQNYFRKIVNDSMYKLYCTVENVMPAAGSEGSFAFVSLSLKKKFDLNELPNQKEEEEKDVGQMIQERVKQLEQQLIEEQKAQSQAVDMSKPTHDEQFLLLCEDKNVNVKDYSDSMSRGISSYQIIKVINPSEFYLTLRLSTTLQKKKTAWEREMQAFYNDVKESSPWKIRTSRVFKGRCYVWHDAEKSQWHRVRVLLPEADEDKQVRVWLVDSAEVRVVSMSDMMEINPGFSSWAALAFKAHLVDILPFSKTGTKGQWSQQSIVWFKELCPEKKIFHGVMIERRRYEERKRRPSRGDYFSFGMILSDVRSESPSTNLLYSVQAQLVRHNLARPFGPAAGFYDLAYLDGSIPDYNRRLLEDELTPYLLSKENNPPPSQPVSEISTRGTGIRGGRKIKSISPLAAGSSHQINTCPRRADLIAILQGKTDAEKAIEEQKMLQGNQEDFDFEPRVVRPPGDPSTFHRETELLQDVDNVLPLKMRKNLGWILINNHTVQGLSCFYIQMFSKFEEMCQMMDDLERVVRPAPALDPSTIESGMVIACQIQDEKSVPYWARVFVKNYIPSIGLVKGVLIDYGQEVSAKINVTRALPPYFSTIPSYCQRVHLDMFSSSSTLRKELQEMKPAHGKGWPESLDKAFKRLLVGPYSSYNCVYYCWQASLDRNVGVVELESFNQPLVFDDELQTWVPGKVKKLRELDGINHQKGSNPLVRQFFTSVGINISIEAETEKENPYKFIPLWKLLRSEM